MSILLRQLIWLIFRLPQLNHDRNSQERAKHYDSIAVYLCLSEMGNTAGNCSLKAPFIPMGISFGSHRKRGAQLRFLSFQKR